MGATWGVDGVVGAGAGVGEVVTTGVAGSLTTGVEGVEPGVWLEVTGSVGLSVGTVAGLSLTISSGG